MLSYKEIIIIKERLYMDEKFQFKKKFGQNFLKNEKVLTRIVDIADIKDESLTIEVGPGSGALTKYLKEKGQVLCYEIDKTLEDILMRNFGEEKNVSIYFGDFLKQDIKEDLKDFTYKHLYFVSNVPYYITTPILFKLINTDLYFDKIVMMVQKEVGERFTSPVGKKEYGALTVLLRYYFETKKEFLVSREEFIPKPNVDSVVVSFKPRKDKEELLSEEFFQQLVHDSFQFKRKTLRNNLKKYDLNIVSKVLEKYNLDLNVRAEQLEYNIFVDLANNLYK